MESMLGNVISELLPDPWSTLLVLSTSQLLKFPGTPLKEMVAFASTPTLVGSNPVPAGAAPGTSVASVAKFLDSRFSSATCVLLTT